MMKQETCTPRVQLVSAVSVIGAFLLGCLAYNLGGANQEAKDMAQETAFKALLKLQRQDLANCHAHLADPDANNVDYMKEHMEMLKKQRDDGASLVQSARDEYDECQRELELENEDTSLRSKSNLIKTAQNDLDTWHVVLNQTVESRNFRESDLSKVIFAFRLENSFLQHQIKQREDQLKAKDQAARDFEEQTNADLGVVGTNQDGDLVDDRMAALSKVSLNPRKLLKVSRNPNYDAENEEDEHIRQSGRRFNSPKGNKEQPVPQPVQAVPQPVQPVPQPVQPVPQPVQPVPQPVQPVPQPVQAVPQPVQPVPQPVQAVPQPVQPVPQPARRKGGGRGRRGGQ